MQVIPSIDLYEGQVVRLRQGRYEECTVYATEPTELARSWAKWAKTLHVVDLEGAKLGRPIQKDALRGIVAAFGPGVQVGGGVRSLETLEEYLSLGVSRVVLGTAAVTHPELVRTAAAKYPGQVVVALDAKAGRVATAGWLEVSEHTALELGKELGRLPIAALLYTDIERDGTEVGPNVAATRALAEQSGAAVLASGGVGELKHLSALARASREADGRITGAIIGRALHEGRFTLQQAAESVAASGETP